MPAPTRRPAIVISIDRTRVADRIFKDLKDDIVLGALPHGARLPAERELAERYQVSNPTVREAIRALSLLGFIDVRHGSGAYVSPDAGALISMCLGAVIQLGQLGIADVLGVLGALNERAAVLAAEAATPEDHAALRDALATFNTIDTVESSAAAVRKFHGAVAAASHNSLLEALCRFLVNVQVELALECSERSSEVWTQLLQKLRPLRGRMVKAILAGDRQKALISAQDFQRKAVALIAGLPRSKEIRVDDPMLSKLLSSMVARMAPV